MSDSRLQEAVLRRIEENSIEEARFDAESALTIERRLAREPEWVWRMLTTAAGTAQWSPCIPTRDMAGTGPYELQEDPSDDLVDGSVTAFEPPSRLEHHWGAETLDWELSPADGYTDLRLTQTCSSDDMVLACAAGWHICLATLETLADGDDASPVLGMESMPYGWERLRDEYAEKFGITPSWTPGEEPAPGA